MDNVANHKIVSLWKIGNAIYKCVYKCSPVVFVLLLRNEFCSNIARTNTRWLVSANYEAAVSNNFNPHRRIPTQPRVQASIPSYKLVHSVVLHRLKLRCSTSSSGSRRVTPDWNY